MNEYIYIVIIITVIMITIITIILIMTIIISKMIIKSYRWQAGKIGLAASGFNNTDICVHPCDGEVGWNNYAAVSAGSAGVRGGIDKVRP